MAPKAKYEEIIDWIQAGIEEKAFLPGERILSENDLREMFQVSRQTVRRAIETMEKAGKLERRKGSGTYVRADVIDKKTKRIAVMTTYMDEYIFNSIIQELEKELSKAGYTLQMSITNNKVEKERFVLKNICEDMQIDGLIVEATQSALPNPNLNLYRKIQEEKIPILFVNSYYPEFSAPHVSLNDKMAGKIATEYLLKCGHKKIAGIFKSDDGQGHLRYAGYVEALMGADVRIDRRSIVWIDTEEQMRMKEDTSWILRRLQGCDSCVCYNDDIANQLVGICIEQGVSVPDDISIIGIDNSQLSVLCKVPLTSVENPTKELGKTTAIKMLNMIQGMDEGTVELEPVIIHRNSVEMMKKQ